MALGTGYGRDVDERKDTEGHVGPLEEVMADLRRDWDAPGTNVRNITFAQSVTEIANFLTSRGFNL